MKWNKNNKSQKRNVDVDLLKIEVGINNHADKKH